MANTGSGGILPGAAYLGKDGSDVYMKVQSDGALLSKPASYDAAVTLLDGVEFEDEVLVGSSIASADDGKYFTMQTAHALFVVWADETASPTNKPSVANADYYISVPYTDGDGATVFAEAMATAINSHVYAKEQVTASVSTATVTITALYGGACSGCVDVDFGAILSISHVVAGAGDYDKVSKTDVDQAFTIEEDETFDTGQLDTIILTDQLSFEAKSINMLAKNYNVARSKFHRKTCQVILFDKSGTTKRLETATFVVNVQLVKEDQIPKIRFYGTKSSSDIDSFHAVYDMAEA